MVANRSLLSDPNCCRVRQKDGNPLQYALRRRVSVSRCRRLELDTEIQDPERTGCAPTGFIQPRFGGWRKQRLGANTLIEPYDHRDHERKGIFFA